MSARLEKLRSKADEGFTLIEMLLVVMIMGILATVGAFGLASYQAGATLNACLTQKSTINTAVQTYLLETDKALMTEFPSLGLDQAEWLAALQFDDYLALFPVPVVVQFGSLTPVEVTDAGVVTGC